MSSSSSLVAVLLIIQELSAQVHLHGCVFYVICEDFSEEIEARGSIDSNEAGLASSLDRAVHDVQNSLLQRGGRSDDVISHGADITEIVGQSNKNP